MYTEAAKETENDLLRQAYLTIKAASETAISIKDPRAAAYALGWEIFMKRKHLFKMLNNSPIKR